MRGIGVAAGIELFDEIVQRMPLSDVCKMQDYSRTPPLPHGCEFLKFNLYC